MKIHEYLYKGNAFQKFVNMLHVSLGRFCQTMVSEYRVLSFSDLVNKLVAVDDVYFIFLIALRR